MQLVPNVVRLPELGQVWGDPGNFDSFKQAVQNHNPVQWQELSAWFLSATRDRGYILEVPAGEELDALLAGVPQLFNLTILFGTLEAVEAQVQYGPESCLFGGILMDFADGLELSVHT